MERHGNKDAMRHGLKEHAEAPLFGGKTETASSTPVAGHTTGGGVSFGEAAHHMKAERGEAHKFSSTHPDSHFLAGHHRTGSHGGGPDAFCHSSKSGQLRVSGVKGAHQIGKR